MRDKTLKVGQNGCELGGIHQEVVRSYPDPNWLEEKLPQRQLGLEDYKDLTKGMTTEQLIKLKEHIEQEIFKHLGS